MKLSFLIAASLFLNTSIFSLEYLDFHSSLFKEQKIEVATKIPSLSNQSCTNILSGLSCLGHHLSFFGPLDRTSFPSAYYLKSIKSGENFIGGEALAVCLISSEKTFLLDAINDVDAKVFDKVKLFHVHAAQLNNIALLKTCLDIAEKKGIIVSFDLADVTYVKKYKDEILNLLPRYIDIIFANEKEIFELTQLPPQKACDYLATFCKVVVITMGYSGSWVKSGKTRFYTPSLKTNQIENAGVGDFFISGFLHAYLNETSLPECSWMGSYVASKALENSTKCKDFSFWHEMAYSLQLARKME